MKTIILFTIIALTAMTSSKPINSSQRNLSVTDENFFKQELQNSVLEFCEDIGIDPDSVYIPFKDI